MRLKNRFMCIALCALLVLQCTACAMENTAGTAGTMAVFFLDADGDALVEERMETPTGSADDKVTAILARLEEGPKTLGHLALFPEDLGISSLLISGPESRVEIDFTEAYLSMPRSREVLVRAGVVRSLVQLPEIASVSFTVSGEPIRDSKGAAIGAMNADSFIENTGRQLNTYLHTTIQLYFATPEGDSFKLENRSIYYASSMPLEWAIVERLIGGPKLKDTNATLPAGTQILSLSSTEGTCYVNFNDSFLNDVPGVTDEVKVYSVVNSLLTNSSITAVQISVNGESNVSAGELTLAEPFTKVLDL